MGINSFLIRLLVALVFCVAGTVLADSSAPVAKPHVIGSYPHDTAAFTEGLLWDGALLYESTGTLGVSALTLRELGTGRVLHKHRLAPEMFGEGIALVADEIIQLTWKNHQAFVYDKRNLRLKRILPYPWDGWGLTYDGQHLIASDGTAQLRFLDPVTLKEIRSIEVRDGTRLIDQLNELEYVHGEILANVFETDRIARISATGQVLGWLDLSGLYPEAERPSANAVLNGIAYDARQNVLIVTGKNWPKLFVIRAP